MLITIAQTQDVNTMEEMVNSPTMYLEICGRKFLMKFDSYDNLMFDTHTIKFVVYHPDGEEWIRHEQEYHNQMFEDMSIEEYLIMVKRTFLYYIMENSDFN